MYSVNMVLEIFNELASFVNGGWLWWCENSGIRAIPSILALLLVMVTCYSWLAKKKPCPPPLPPGPFGVPLLGNLPFIDPDLPRHFSNLSQTYGPIFKLKFGSKIIIVINSPSLAKQVLKDHDAFFANRDPPATAIAITYGGLDIAWADQGPIWRKLRKIFVSEIMSHATLNASVNLRRQEVHNMVKEVYAKSDTPVNIGEQMFFTFLNVAMNMIWGGTSQHDDEDRSRVGGEFRKVIVEIVELLGKPNVSDLFPILSRFDLQGLVSKAKKHLSWFDKIFDSLITRRTTPGDDADDSDSIGNNDFMQFLLKLKQSGDEKTSLSMDQIKALFMDIFVGATETSAATVEWAMAELLQNPTLMVKVKEELNQLVGNNNIVEEHHLAKLYYLDAVLKETLRLHPALPLLVPHCPSESCVIDKYTIPKGAQVMFNVWAMQRDSGAWDDPLEFNPDRFLATKYDYQGNNFNFLPFGSGRRICAGIPLAEKLILYGLASLVHAFEWKLLDETTKIDFSDKFGLVYKKKEPLVAIPMARESIMEHYV